MAIYHHSTSVIKRSAGKSALGAAAYRAAAKLVDAAKEKIFDYTRKAGVDLSQILTPVAASWIIDRQQLWERVEQRELRVDSQLAREVTIAIPKELDRDSQVALVREYVQSSYVDCGMVADINLHHLDGNNPHAYIMLTMRQLQVDDRGEVSFGNKDRSWNNKALLVENRQRWEQLANQYLERAGHEDRIDCRSHEDRGIDRLPQIHLGSEAANMRAKSIATDRGTQYDRIEWLNANIDRELEEICLADDISIPVVESPAEQAERDETMVIVAHAYPALKTTPEYQAAAARERARNQVNYRAALKILKMGSKTQLLPAPPTVKWQRILTQPTQPETIDTLQRSLSELGGNIQAGNYQATVGVDRIDVSYQERLVLSIDTSGKNWVSQAIDPANAAPTIDQYEAGLVRSLLSELDNAQEHELEQGLVSPQELVAEIETAQAVVAEIEVDLSDEIEVDLSEECEIEIDFGRRERDRGRGR